MENLFELFKKYAEENALIGEKRTHIVAGVSGGADSVCLLLLLKKLADERAERNLQKCALELTAVHINHNIRGESADKDQAFVEGLCKKLGVSCVVYSEDVVARAKKQGLSTEEAGRKTRYEKFEETASKTAEKNPEDDVKIAVAHHRDDNAETIIFNMIRGSALKGISGMKAKSEEGKIEIIRPLLFAQRQDIEEYLALQGQEYVQDETNTDTDISRNAVRHIIIPEMQRINPRAVEHILRAAESVRAADEYLETQAGKAFEQACIEYRKETDGCLALRTECLKELNPVIAEKVIYNAIVKARGAAADITKVHVADVEKLIWLSNGKSINLPGKMQAFRENDEIVFKKNIETDESRGFDEIQIPLDFENGKKIVKLPDGAVLTLEKISVNQANFAELIEKNLYTKAFDYDKISGSLFWGTRKNGDKISLKNGTKNLSRIFTDGKVSKSERDKIPILKDENEILWIVGMRIGEKYKITEKTKNALKVKISGGQYSG